VYTQRKRVKFSNDTCLRILKDEGYLIRRMLCTIYFCDFFPKKDKCKPCAWGEC